MMQIFKIFTIHKMTHLYTADVLMEGVIKLYLIIGTCGAVVCTTSFTQMINSFLVKVTGYLSILDHSCAAD